MITIDKKKVAELIRTQYAEALVSHPLPEEQEFIAQELEKKAEATLTSLVTTKFIKAAHKEWLASRKSPKKDK